MSVHGNFIMFEGMDGSGKTTIAQAFVQELARRRRSLVYDLPEACRKSGELPLPWKAPGQIIFSAEPTRVWIGAAIRNEMTRNGTGYGAAAVAEAFALDRLVLYRRFIIPMLESGAIVVQDRGLPSSMTYQPLMDTSLTLDRVLALPGNMLELEHAPKHLIIARCTAKTAMARLAARSEKKDDSIFEREAFLTELAKRYEAEWLRQILEKHGSEIRYIDAEQPLEAVKAEAVRLANELCPFTR